MSLSFDEYLAEQLKDPQFKAEYVALQPEHAIVQSVLDARLAAGISQQELSKRTGINQGDISKIERGTANPSLRTLKRLAAGLGRQLKIEFIPIA